MTQPEAAPIIQLLPRQFSCSLTHSAAASLIQLLQTQEACHDTDSDSECVSWNSEAAIEECPRHDWIKRGALIRCVSRADAASVALVLVAENAGVSGRGGVGVNGSKH